MYGYSEGQENINYYHILGVNPGASARDIQNAYRHKAKELHPDRGGSIADFQMLQKAYNILSKDSSRTVYDNRFSMTHHELKTTNTYVPSYPSPNQYQHQPQAPQRFNPRPPHSYQSTLPNQGGGGGGFKKGGFNHAAFIAERQEILNRQRERQEYEENKKRNRSRPGKEKFAKKRSEDLRDQLWKEKYVLGVNVDDNDENYARKKSVYLSERDAFKSPENVFNGRFDRNAFNRYFDEMKKETESRDLIIYEEPSPCMTIFSGANSMQCAGSEFAEFSSDPNKICHSTAEMSFMNPNELSSERYEQYRSQPDITKIDSALSKKEIERLAMKQRQSIEEYGSSSFRNHKKSRRDRKGGIHGDLFPAEDEPLHEDDYTYYSD